MKFADEAKDALEAIQESGAAVTWARPDPAGTYNPLSDTTAAPPAPSDLAASSYAIEAEKDESFRPNTSAEARESAELWVAALGADFPPLEGMTSTWAGETWTILKVDPLAPDGDPILWRLFIQR